MLYGLELYHDFIVHQQINFVTTLYFNAIVNNRQPRL